MNLVFVGWNHRQAPLDLRERLAFTPERALAALDGLFKEKILTEGAIVSTCNRSEVYGVTEQEDSVPALSGYLARFHDVDAELLSSSMLTGRGDASVRHLFRVASGLDSMVLGEAQILGQVREAHRIASTARTTRAVTNRLFQMALECGKRVRTETALGTRPTSVPGIALSLAGRVFESLKGLRVLLIGAGETIELTARLLVDEGVTQLTFTNRTAGKADALAAEANGVAVPWERRVAAAGEADIILSATGATEPILLADELKKVLKATRRRGPLLILDMAVPRDVDPGVDDLDDVYRYDMDALHEVANKNAAERLAEAPAAEAIVEEMVKRFSEWFGLLLHMDVVRNLREKLDGIRKAELERYANRLGKMNEADREWVGKLTESLISKILHDPTLALKDGDPAERLERAAIARTLFKLEEKE
jgi:glutamyl-tRNA reductase